MISQKPLVARAAEKVNYFIAPRQKDRVRNSQVTRTDPVVDKSHPHPVDLTLPSLEVGGQVIWEEIRGTHQPLILPTGSQLEL